MRNKVIIDLDKLSDNIDIFLKKIPIEKFMAVVKANAYGYGYEQITKLCIKKGITWYGVATYDEAIQLYDISKDINILILGPVETEKYEDLAKKNIHITVTSFDEISYIKEKGLNINVHLAYDTGMGRIGFSKKDIEKAIELAKPIGLFTHMSVAETDEKYTRLQLEKFDEIANKYDIKYKHALNSHATDKYYDEYNKYDLYRVGILMYGGEPSEKIKGLKQIISFYARVSYVKTLTEDGFIGYGNTFYAKKGMIIGTISSGYADGVDRLASNHGYVCINNKHYEIIGNICMDQFMILADENVKAGDYAEVYGDNINLFDFSTRCKTVSYEITCNIGRRVKRYYKLGGKYDI